MYASQKDDWDLAVRAVKVATNDRDAYSHFTSTTFERYLDRLSHDMQLALLRALTCKSGSLHIPLYWTNVDKGFVKPAPADGHARPR